MGCPPRYPRLKAKSNSTVEVRQYRTIRRHIVHSAVSLLFLAEFRLAERGKNPELTVAQVQAATAALVPIWTLGGRCSRKRAEAISRRLFLTQQRNARRPQPPTANPTPIARKSVFVNCAIICQPWRL